MQDLDNTQCLKNAQDGLAEAYDTVKNGSNVHGFLRWNDNELLNVSIKKMQGNLARLNLLEKHDVLCEPEQVQELCE